MFHRFHVDPRGRDYLRFLWWEEGDTSKPPVELRMNFHVFGATSSAGCANFSLKYLSKSYNMEFASAASFIYQDFYVDDGITSVENPDQAIRIIQEAREICSLVKTRLHKFISNNRTVIESIPVTERANEIQEVDLAKEKLPTERTSGIHWNIESDMFCFPFHVKECATTCRGIVSTIASIYDPLGFISPFVLKGKTIRSISWDDPIPEVLATRWEKWKSDYVI